ncbi:SRPBCC family protein [uncultured Williamsia sp.]|uniref:SRPBCC family protein n=1 Tax=uncultured Williamsia sp. TaxID=259311 RepID=UPI002624D619|nr:SRPBCC family protein [uncultured Williamsia sp.]
MTPKSFRVQRSRTIAAPAADIVRELEDFRRWVAWSPWEGSDPTMSREYDGPTSGVGARYRWSGNRKAGEGSMEIVAVDRPRSVDIRVVFSRPMRADNRVRFDLADTDGGTRVTWSMTGESSGLAGLFSRIVPMDRLVGGDFERGLDRLEATVTAGRQA